MATPITAGEAAVVLDVHVQTIYELIRDGKLTASRFGRNYVLDLDEVLELGRLRARAKRAEAEEILARLERAKKNFSDRDDNIDIDDSPHAQMLARTTLVQSPSEHLLVDIPAA